MTTSDTPDLSGGSRHSLVEDAYAVAIGCTFVALGLVFLKAAGLITGGVAGIALLLSYLVPLPAGLLFTLINIPFFLVARATMGTRFLVKTVIVNLGVTALAWIMPDAFMLAQVNALFAALFGGTIIGMGILALARHGAGVGGLGVLALMLQRRRGWNAGRTQLVGDCFILAAAIPVLDPRQFLLSVVSAAAISGVIIAYHKPGRYMGY